MSYGKHQSFYIKSNWINKGIMAISQFGPNFFFDVENYKEIGLGKNMFQSLKYWLEATNIVEIQNQNHIFTTFGEFVRDKDPGCIKPFTLLLTHYFLVCEFKPNNIEKSSAFFWYFNVNREQISRKEKLLENLTNWDAKNSIRATSINTLNRDLECIISTYTKNHMVHPEDKNTSLLSSLNLIKIQDNFNMKNSINSKYIDLDAIMYILLKMNETNKITSLNSLLDEIDSPGRIFNISRSEMIEIIENMIAQEYPIQISRTNNLDTIIITSMYNASDFLNIKISGGNL